MRHTQFPDDLNINTHSLFVPVTLILVNLVQQGTARVQPPLSAGRDSLLTSSLPGNKATTH